VKVCQDLCGPVKVHSFRDKQSFGFVQFSDAEVSLLVCLFWCLLSFSHVKPPFERSKTSRLMGRRFLVRFSFGNIFMITAETCSAITPGRDPRTHDAKSEFKNATLVLKNLPFQLKQEKLEEILVVAVMSTCNQCRMRWNQNL
jgi:hypothetical protein